jgi:hypothetical protein
MDVIGDLVARDRRSERLAVRAPAADRALDYHDFCTTAWKAGNFLRYLGVGRAVLVAVAPDPLPEPLLTFFGAAQLGAVTRFEPVTDGSARVVVVHRDRESAVELPPESKLAVYGGEPSSPTVSHWEGTVWSENPSFPPTDVAPDATALRTGDEAYSHADLLGAARSVVASLDLSRADTLRVAASLADPRAVAALLAPLLVGGAVSLATDDHGRVAVADDESRRLALADVSL